MLYIGRMTFDDLFRHYGSVQKAANALDRERTTIYNWRDGGIPEDAQAYVEIMTGGALRADLPKRPQELQA